MAVLLALGTSVAYGVANLLAPLLVRRFPLAAVLLAGQAVALTLTLVGLTLAGEPVPTAGDIAIGMLAGAGNAAALIGFLMAAEAGPVSLAAPIGATGGVLPVLYDLARGASLDTLEAVGLTLALVGVAIAARRPSGGAAPPEHEDLRACVTYALISAAGFGVLLILLPHAADGGRWWALADARAVMFLAVVGFAVATGRSLRAPARELPRLAVPGILLLAGTLLYTLATQRGSLSVVAVLASLNPAVTVGLAFFLLGERVTRTQALGIGCIIAGVVAVAA